MDKIKIKKDKYKNKRGGYSRLLNIICQKCEKQVCLYQKDGPGNLRRMYIDRILKSSVALNKKELLCPLNHLLGIKIIYEKENRPAYRLFVDSVIKKIIKF